MKEETCVKYAEYLLKNFVIPRIDEIYDRNWSRRGISIVLDDSNGISNEDIYYGKHSICTVYHDKTELSYTNEQIADFFTFEIDNDNINDSMFVFENHYDTAEHIGDIKIFHVPSSVWEPTYEPFQNFDEVTSVIRTLKQLMLKKYGKSHEINIYGEREHQIQELSKLYAKIANIKTEYRLTEKEVTKARNNCSKWIGLV